LGDPEFGGVGVTGREGDLVEFGRLDGIGLEGDESGEDFGVGGIGFVVLDGEVGEVGDEGWVREEVGIGLGDKVEELLSCDRG